MKKELLVEGKTKKVWSCKDNPEMVVIENKSKITAFDDPLATREFETKAKCATNTTCRVFELLKSAGIPVAYEKQLSETDFLAPYCEMIPLEVIARRYAVGSYLKRFPNMSTDTNNPDRFHSLKIELFLKTTKGELEISGEKVIEGLSPEKGEEDPLIIPNTVGVWELYHPKTPSWEKSAFLERIIEPQKVLISKSLSGILVSEEKLFQHGDGSFDKAASIVAQEILQVIEEITRKTFLVLESAWAQQNMRLIDFKIEFGFNSAGQLMVADVIDNDSWRLRTKNWTELSKESFRQGEDLTEVEKKYGIVSQMVNNFRLPN
ncbi:MAG: phosphoribosylaminoimidazolesuccinocarboxamide synthase [Patescibacteria group bacterium]|nr:phosphoribosylaminoimidazolesuccinocarboxamide synthase [Patescibacteria group bacterium]